MSNLLKSLYHHIPDPVIFLLVSGAVFFAGATLSYLLSIFFTKIACQFNYLDYPVGRKTHKKPTPFLGGIGLFVSFWFVVFCGILAAKLISYRVSIFQLIQSPLPDIFYLIPKIGGIFFGSLIILLTGFLDDKYHWLPLQKLAGQIAAAGILISFGFTINLVEGLGIFGYAVTFLWILLIINAFNLIDSIDGHCAGIALVSSIVFFWLTQIIGQHLTGFMLIAFAGTLLGFLPHNFKPAKIFLGDNGSLFIGYMMAAFTLLCRYQAPETTYATVFIPVLMFSVPIYDTLSVMVVRTFRGIPFWKGDRNHFAHRLVKLGMSEKIAVFFSYFVSVTVGLIAILTTQVTQFGAVLIGFITVCIVGVIAFLEFYAAERINIAESLAIKGRRRKEDILEEEEKRFR